MNQREFDLEDRLRQEMRRVDVPEGFAERVMERVASVAEDERKRRLVVMPRRMVSFAVAAMLLLGIVLSGWQWRQQQVLRERQAAELARRQFEVAMQVTGRTLVEVQERIEHAGEIHTEHRKREVE